MYMIAGCLTATSLVSSSGVLNKHFFVNWYKKHGRGFPWRYEGILPFRSMVTEMLLRQTRAEAVAKLWDKFFERYPDAETLATADGQSLMNHHGRYLQ
jgi:adenine-specific DNA glycosylase